MQFGTICLHSSLLISQYVVESTVVHVYGKVASVEDEYSGEYIRMVMNDGEAVDELNEKEANGGFNYVLYLLTIFWVILLCVQYYCVYTFYKNI